MSEPTERRNTENGTSVELHIHEYDNAVFPPVLFIVCDRRLDKITESFIEIDGAPLSLEDIDNYTPAFVYRQLVVPKEKKDSEPGILIVFQHKKWMQEDVVAHEAFHAACLYADYLGISYEESDANESRAYLLSWVVRCCQKTRGSVNKKTAFHEKKG